MESLFLEPCYVNSSDVYRSRRRHNLPPCPVDPMAFLSATLRQFFPLAKPCPSRAVCFSTTTPWNAWIGSSLTLGEACVVTGAGRYTAAGDTETTMTCVSDPELPSMLLEGSTHSGKLAPCDLSTLMPRSTVSHDCPNTIFEKSCTANGSYDKAAISGTAASTAWTGGSNGALVSDPTLLYPTCEARTCFIGRLLAQRLFVWTGLRFPSPPVSTNC